MRKFSDTVAARRAVDPEFAAELDRLEQEDETIKGSCSEKTPQAGEPQTPLNVTDGDDK